MRNARRSPQDYVLRVAAEEIEFMEREHLLQTYPHIENFIKRPIGRFILRHVQNFCWTVERFIRKARAALTRPPPRKGTMVKPIDVATAWSVAPNRPRIWIDLTNTYRHGFEGGIGRVTMKLARAAFKTGLAQPVLVQDGDVYEYAGTKALGAKLSFGPDIVYVLADSYWQQAKEYRGVCDRAKADGAKIVVLVHDVIPLYYPSFSRTCLVENFTTAFQDVVERCDAVIAVSAYSREKVRQAIIEMRMRVGRPLPLTHFRLGSDGHVGIVREGQVREGQVREGQVREGQVREGQVREGQVRDGQVREGQVREGQVREAVCGLFDHDHVFVSVGTLEPRKGYAISLDAFDAVWQRGIDCRFVIIGRPGWISRALERRIVTHPRYGEALHWLADASDSELAFAYRHAHCLIQASITEGFGLPIVEANLEGTPVIATDNEIFRELAGNAITYFKSCDGLDLAEKIESATVTPLQYEPLPALTWEQSLAQMVSRISETLTDRRAEAA